jgi:hypothetical protein
MKRRINMVLLGMVCIILGSTPAFAARALRDVPFDVCVFLDKYDPSAASYVVSTRDKLLEARNPSFLSTKEVSSLDEGDSCDIAVRITQPGTWSVKADIISMETKAVLTSVDSSGFLSSNRVVTQVFSALDPDTSLAKRIMQERATRLAKLQAKKEEPVKRTSQNDTHGAAAAVAAAVRSDIDELPRKTTLLNKNAYAVVIGIENYRQKLPNADFAVSDAQITTDYLTKVMGYPEANVVTLTNDHAALGDFVKYFEKWLPNNVEQGGTVFIYYSGHGAPNPKTGDSYLVPYDGDPSFIEETGYPLKRMYTALGKLHAKEIIVALDSCFSGAGGRSVLAKGARPLVMHLNMDTGATKNMTVFAASSGDQISSTYDEKGHGLFTYFMLKGIKEEGVLKQNGSLDFGDLFSYVKPQVERIARKLYNNEQTPQLIGPNR